MEPSPDIKRYSSALEKVSSKQVSVVLDKRSTGIHMPKSRMLLFLLIFLSTTITFLLFSAAASAAEEDTISTDPGVIEGIEKEATDGEAAAVDQETVAIDTESKSGAKEPLDNTPTSGIYDPAWENQKPAESDVAIADAGNEGDSATNSGLTADPQCLTIDKTDNGATAAAGGSLTYEISVANNAATRVASGYAVTDVPDINTTVNDALWVDNGDGTWTYDGALPELAPGESHTISMTVDVAGVMPYGVEELKNCSYLYVDCELIDSACDTTPGDWDPIITLEKSDDPEPVAAGDELTYTITVGNDPTATQVLRVYQIEDLPDGNVTVTDPAWSEVAPGEWHYDTGLARSIYLAPGETHAVTLTVQVDGVMPAGDNQLDNRACAWDFKLGTLTRACDDEPTEVLAHPELCINKVVEDASGNGIAEPGETLTYTIRVTNNGTQDLANAKVLDGGANDTDTAFPPYLQWDTGPIAGGGGSWSTSYTAVVDDPLPAVVDGIPVPGVFFGDGINDNTISNRAFIEGTNLRADTTIPVPCVDISIDKTVTDASGNGLAEPGETLTYTITVTNTSGRDHAAVTVTDTGANNTDGEPRSWDTGVIGGYGSWSVSFDVMVDNPLPVIVDGDGDGINDDTIRNTACIEGTEKCASTCITVNAEEILEITKDVSDDSGNGLAEPGEKLTYTITVTNSGNRDWAGGKVTDSGANNTSGSEQSWGTGMIEGGGGTWQTSFAVVVDDLLPAVIDGLPVPSGDGVNDDTISNLAELFDLCDHKIDEDEATIKVNASPELVIIKGDNINGIMQGFGIDGMHHTVGGEAATGDTIVYTIDVYNEGYRDATEVTVFELQVPEHTIFVTGDPGNAGWVEVGGEYSYKIGDMAARSGPVSLTFVVKVIDVLPAGVDSTLNTVKVEHSMQTFESNTNNNAADDLSTLLAAPDLVITKDDGVVRVAPGQVLVYTITVTNAGNQDATGVVVTEIVPEYTTFMADDPRNTAGWKAESASPDNRMYSYQIGHLQVGDEYTVTLTFVVRVDEDMPLGLTNIINIVSVADDGANGVEANMDDNVAMDTDVVEVTPPTVPPAPPPMTPKPLPRTGMNGTITALSVLLAILGMGLAIRSRSRRA